MLFIRIHFYIKWLLIISATVKIFKTYLRRLISEIYYVTNNEEKKK